MSAGIFSFASGGQVQQVGLQRDDCIKTAAEKIILAAVLA
jgi:hypothetical protein